VTIGDLRIDAANLQRRIVQRRVDEAAFDDTARIGRIVEITLEQLAELVVRRR
jgi:hypothetical protein